MKNQCIQKAIKAHWCVFIIIITMQILSAIAAHFIINKVCDEKIITLVVDCLSTGFITLVAILQIRKIKRYNKLLYARPIGGIIEDIMILTYGHGDNKSRELNILVRSDEDNQLYLAVGDDNMSTYSYTYTANGRQVNRVHFIRKDNEETNIGDAVHFYIDTKLSTPTLQVINDNVIVIKKIKHKYQHINPKYSVHHFQEYHYYRGFVELLTSLPYYPPQR